MQPRTPPATIDDIASRLRDGQYICDIARACGVSESMVRKVAKTRQIKHARCKQGTRWNMAPKSVPITTVEAAPNWSSVASSLRWGNNWGKGFW